MAGIPFFHPLRAHQLTIVVCIHCGWGSNHWWLWHLLLLAWQVIIHSSLQRVNLIRAIVKELSLSYFCMVISKLYQPISFQRFLITVFNSATLLRLCIFYGFTLEKASLIMCSVLKHFSWYIHCFIRVQK